MLTDDGKAMRLVAQQGLPDDVQVAERLVPRDCGVCGIAAAGDVLGWVDDVRTCAKHTDHAYFGIQCQRKAKPVGRKGCLRRSEQGCYNC